MRQIEVVRLTSLSSGRGPTSRSLPSQPLGGCVEYGRWKEVLKVTSEAVELDGQLAGATCRLRPDLGIALNNLGLGNRLSNSVGEEGAEVRRQIRVGDGEAEQPAAQ